MKLIPASRARWIIPTHSSRSVLPQAPNIMVPRQSGLTWTPVVPSATYLTPVSLPAGQRSPCEDSTPALVAVHRLVGDPDQVVGALAEAPGERDADAGPDAPVPGAHRDRLGYRIGHAGGEGPDLAVGVETLAEHGELVAADPGDGVVGPHHRGEPPGDL